MPYKLSTVPCWDDEGSILSLSYTGVVPFAERTRALNEMSAILTTTTIRRILVDFSEAQLETGDDGERVDFLAQSLTAQGFDKCRVAMIGLKRDDAQTFHTTAQVRRLNMREFSRAEDGVEWLCGNAERPQFIS